MTVIVTVMVGSMREHGTHLWQERVSNIAQYQSNLVPEYLQI